MPAEWRAFLQSQGAQFELENVLDFGHPEQEAAAAANADILAALPFLSVLKITGTDAAAFLHGQFTSDINRLAEGEVQLSAWCNPKGQIIANFIISRTVNEYILLLPKQMSTTFARRLGMYVLRSDVTVQICDESIQCIGVKQAGDQPAVADNLEQVLPQATAGQNDLTWLPVPGNRNRVIITAPEHILRNAWPKLSPAFTPVGSHHWQLFDILDGLPWILEATTEAFLPQYLNLDRLQAVSFSKGCFPGQEVIARLQHRGKVKQQLVILNVENESPIHPGDKVYASDIERSIGTVLNTATHPDEGSYALAVMDVNYGDAEQLYLTLNKIPISIITPPTYAALT